MALRCDDFTAQRQPRCSARHRLPAQLRWGRTCSTGNWCKCWKIRAMSSKVSICARWRRCPPGWRPSPPCCSKPSVNRPAGDEAASPGRAAGLSLVLQLDAAQPPQERLLQQPCRAERRLRIIQPFGPHVGDTVALGVRSARVRQCRHLCCPATTAPAVRRSNRHRLGLQAFADLIPQRHPRLMRQHHRRNGQPQRIEIGAAPAAAAAPGDAPPWRRGRPPLSAADRRGAMANRAAGCGCPTPTAAPDPVGADRRRGRRPRCAPPAWANRHRADPPPAVRCRKADAPRRAPGREPAEGAHR